MQAHFELLERVVTASMAYSRRKRALRALLRRDISERTRRATLRRLVETTRRHREARARAIMVGHAVSAHVASTLEY